MNNSNKKIIFNLIGQYFVIQNVAKDISVILSKYNIQHNIIYFDKKNWLSVYNNHKESIICKCNYLDHDEIKNISSKLNVKPINLVINDDITYKDCDFITEQYNTSDSWINKKTKIEKYIL